MKKLLLLAAVFVTGFTAMAQQKADEAIKVSTEKYDFGKIKQGVPVTTYFTITNITNKPVAIQSATAGCGCTTPEFSKEPFSPNSISKLKVGYNAAAVGHFEKTVSVSIAGYTQPKVITITGEVMEPNAYEAYTKTDDFKKAEKAKADALVKEAKEAKKAAKGKSKK